MQENSDKIILSDLIDIKLLQELQDNFAKAMNMASITVDEKGPITKASNFTDFCKKFVRKNLIGSQRCIDCDIKWGKIAANKKAPVVYTCHVGLTDFAVPIIVEGQHIASILGGQILTKKPDESVFRKLAKEIGIEEEEYIKALQKINIVSEDKVKAASDLLFLVANTVSQIAVKNLELIKRTRQEEIYKNLVETVRSSLDIDETLNIICDEVGRLFNVQRATIIEFYDKKDFSRWKTRREYKQRDDIIGLLDFNFDPRAGEYNGYHVMQQGKNLIINDIKKSNTPEYYKETYKKMGVKSILSVPIKNNEDKFGIIFLSAVDEYRKWSDDEIRMLENISTQIYVAIRQAEMYKDQKQTAEREAILRQIIEKVSSELDIEKTLYFICEEVTKNFNVQRAAISVFPDPEDYEVYELRKEYKISPDITGFIGSENLSKVAAFWGENLTKCSEVLAIDNIDLADVPDIFKNTYKKMGVKSIIGTAIKRGNDVWGTLVLAEYNNYRHWTSEEKDLLETISNQVYIAINQAELFQKVQKQAQREVLIRKVIESVRSSFDLIEVKKKVIEEICKTFKADRCYFRRYDIANDIFSKPDSEYLAAPDVLSMSNIEPDQENIKFYADWVKSQNKGFYPVIMDTTFVQGTPLETYFNKYEIKANCTVPIISLQSEVYWLVLHYLKEIPNFSEEDKKLLETIAYQIDIAFEQIQLYNTEKATAKRERLIREIVSEFSSTLDLNKIKKIFVTKLGEALESDFDILYVYNSEIQRFLPVDEYSVHISSDQIQSPVGINIMEEYGWREYFISKKLTEVVYSDIEKFKKDYDLYGSIGEEFLNHYNIKSAIVIPVVYSGEMFGVLGMNFVNKQKNITEDDVSLVKTVANQVAIALYQAKLYNAKQAQAEREKVLRHFIQTARTSLDIHKIKQTFVNETAKIFSADRCMLVEFDDLKKTFLQLDEFSEYRSSQQFRSYVGYDFGSPEVNGFSDIFKQLRTIYVEDSVEYVKNNNLYGTDVERYLIESGLKTGFGMSIYYQNILMGALVIHFIKEKRVFTPEDFDLFGDIVSQAGSVLYQSKLYEITKLQAQREKISRNIIEILRSTLDKKIIKHLFVKNIGKYYNADRVFFADYELKEKKYLPVEKEAEYLSSPEEMSFVGYDWSGDESKDYIAPLLEKRELLIPCFEEYIKTNQKSKEFIHLFEMANVKSSYNFPVLYQQKIMGYFCIEFTKDINRLSNDDISSIRNICSQAGIALYHSSLYEIAQKTAQAHIEFVTKISNELKEPINLIIQFSEKLSQQELASDEEMEYLAIINENAKKLLEFMDDTISAIRLEMKLE